MPSEPGYVLWYNNSATSKYTNDALEFLHAIDQEIVRTKLVKPEANVTASWAYFPEVKARIAQMDVVSANGGVYFYLVPMIVFFVLLTNIVQEKEANLRTGMRMMGMSSAVYWTCWTLQALAFVVGSTLVLMAAAAACQFDVFLNANQAVLFITFAFYGLAIVAMAFCFSAFIQKVQTAQAVGYGLILLGFIFQSILTGGYGIFVDLLYSDMIPDWVVFIRIVFMQYAPFNFAKVYSDVAYLSGNTIDFRQGIVKKGAGFFWHDLWNATDRSLGNFHYTSPPPYEALLILLYNTLTWGLLAWYFNNVLGEGERDAPVTALAVLRERLTLLRRCIAVVFSLHERLLGLRLRGAQRAAGGESRRR